VLDASIVNIAPPSVGEDLQLSQADLAWVVMPTDDREHLEQDRAAAGPEVKPGVFGLAHLDGTTEMSGQDAVEAGVKASVDRSTIRRQLGGPNGG